jgi:hypothetical protein
VKQEKEMLLIHALAALRATGDTKAVAEYQLQFPSDMHVHYLLWGHFSKKMDCGKAEQCIDHIIGFQGPDGWLHSCRAHTFLECDEFEQARRAGEEAIRIEPKLVDGYFWTVTSSLRAKNYDAAVGYLTQLDRELGVSIEELIEGSIDPDFLESPQYLKWLDWKLKQESPDVI